MTELNLPWQQLQHEFACEHIELMLVRREPKNGMVVCNQCVRCGAHCGSIKKREVAGDINALPLWDEKLQQNWYNQYDKRKKELIQQQQQQESEDWFARYTKYLSTPQWADLRRKVLARDKYTCQNCFRLVTVETANCHHLTYAGYNQKGYSFAFECVTLCRACHKKVHESDVT
jgi:5-methylcytosine-specific restriction endonuclease McrA